MSEILRFSFWAPFQHHSRSDIAHLHMRIFEIKRVDQSARVLPIHVKEGVKRGKPMSFFYFRKRQELGQEKSGKYRIKNAPLVYLSTYQRCPRVKVSIVGSLRDREVACSASDRQGSNFESCVWRTVSSQSSHHPQEVLLAQFSLYVHKGGLKPDSFHFIYQRCCHLIPSSCLLPADSWISSMCAMSSEPPSSPANSSSPDNLTWVWPHTTVSKPATS